MDNGLGHPHVTLGIEAVPTMGTSFRGGICGYYAVLIKQKTLVQKRLPNGVAISKAEYGDWAVLTR